MPPTSAAKPISYAQSTGLPISPKRFQSSAPAPRKARANISPKVCSVSGPMWISGYTAAILSVVDRDQSALGGDAIEPGPHRRQGLEVEPRLGRDVGVGVKGDVGDREPLADEVGALSQVPLHRLQRFAPGGAPRLEVVRRREVVGGDRVPEPRHRDPRLVLVLLEEQPLQHLPALVVILG